MEAFTNWMHQMPDHPVKYSGAFLAVLWIYNAFAGALLHLICKKKLTDDIAGMIGDIASLVSTIWGAIKTSLLAGFTEEAYFRLLPLALVLSYTDNMYAFFVVALITSTVFSYAHGGGIRLPLQGVGGVLYSLFFLKMGGISGNFLAAYLACAILHTVYDLLPLMALSAIFKYVPQVLENPGCSE